MGGGGKVSRLWHGLYEPASRASALQELNAWCEEYLVPDDVTTTLVRLFFLVKFFFWGSFFFLGKFFFSGEVFFFWWSLLFFFCWSFFFLVNLLVFSLVKFIWSLFFFWWSWMILFLMSWLFLFWRVSLFQLPLVVIFPLFNHLFNPRVCFKFKYGSSVVYITQIFCYIEKILRVDFFISIFLKNVAND